MADEAHEDAERVIRGIERRLAREYSQAVKEVQGKLDDYLARFRKKDQAWREWAEKARADPAEYAKRQEEYRQWRIGQIAVGKRWQALKDELASSLHGVNEAAREIARRRMPEIYAESHNYATYEAEIGARLDTGYTLYDRDAVARLMQDDPQLLPDPGKKASERIRAGLDKRWNRRQIQSVMMQGLLQGESIPKLATRLAKEVGDKNRKAAIRNARTMATGAENAGRVDGYKRARSMGIDMEQEWLATLDGRTRHSHRAVDHERRPVGEKFSNGCRYPGDPQGPPGEVYNCFTGNVGVATDSEILRSYKHEYSGELITIKTARGVQFTCTPNHPVLTRSGWIAARFLREGDNLLVTRIRNFHMARGNPYIKHILTRFDAIHEFFDKFGGERAGNLSVNFHGDVATANVEVIAQKRLLRNGRNASKGEQQNELLFKSPDKSFMSQGSLMEHFRRIWQTAPCFMGGFCEALSFLGRCVSHSVIHGFRPITRLYMGISKHSVNNRSATSMDKGELLHGFSGSKFTDNIVTINKVSGSTHVYNLQTINGYYFIDESMTNAERKSNGYAAIAKNCRCSLRGIVVGLEPQSRQFRDLSDIGGDYGAWKAGRTKAESSPIDLPERKGAAIRQSYVAEYARKAASPVLGRDGR